MTFPQNGGKVYYKILARLNNSNHAEEVISPLTNKRGTKWACVYYSLWLFLALCFVCNILFLRILNVCGVCWLPN